MYRMNTALIVNNCLQAALWLAISAAVSVVLGIVFLMIFKYAPHAATQATIIAQVRSSLALDC